MAFAPTDSPQSGAATPENPDTRGLYLLDCVLLKALTSHEMLRLSLLVGIAATFFACQRSIQDLLINFTRDRALASLR